MAMRPAICRYRNGAPAYAPCRPRRAMAESPRTITPLSTRPSECRRVACGAGPGDDRCRMTPLKRKNAQKFFCRSAGHDGLLAAHREMREPFEARKDAAVFLGQVQQRAEHGLGRAADDAAMLAAVLGNPRAS